MRLLRALADDVSAFAEREAIGGARLLDPHGGGGPASSFGWGS